MSCKNYLPEFSIDMIKYRKRSVIRPDSPVMLSELTALLEYKYSQIDFIDEAVDAGFRLWQRRRIGRLDYFE